MLPRFARSGPVLQPVSVATDLSCAGPSLWEKAVPPGARLDVGRPRKLMVCPSFPLRYAQTHNGIKRVQTETNQHASKQTDKQANNQTQSRKSANKQIKKASRQTSTQQNKQTTPQTNQQSNKQPSQSVSQSVSQSSQ